MANTEPSMLEKWFTAVWNKKNENAIDELMDSQADIIDKKPLKKYKGTSHIKLVYKKLQSMFDDIKIEPEKVHKDGDIEIAYCNVSAFYKRKEIKFRRQAMVRVKNNKIVEASNNFDLELYKRAEKMEKSGALDQLVKSSAKD